MATYIIALRPVFGRASGLVRVGPDGARFSLRGVSFGRAHLILQNGRTRSANVRPTPGGGTAFIPLRAREFPLGAAVTVRGVVMLIGTTGTRASDILEKARQLAVDPEQRRAEEAGIDEEIRPDDEREENKPSVSEPPIAEASASMHSLTEPKPAPEIPKPEALAAEAAREEPFVMPQPPMAQVEATPAPEPEPEKAPEPPKAPEIQITPAQQEILNKWRQTMNIPEPAAKPPEGAAQTVSVKKADSAPPVAAQADSPQKAESVAPPSEKSAEPKAEPAAAPPAEEDCKCSEAERGGMIASFMMGQEDPQDSQPQQAPQPQTPAFASATMPEPERAAPPSAPPQEERFDVEAARSPHAFYQPILEDDDSDQLGWSAPATASGERRERPMVGRRLGVFSNAFPGDWPRVNWQVFSHPGGTHLLRARIDDKELYALPARPSATPPAGIPATARYCVSRTGQGYWVF